MWVKFPLFPQYIQRGVFWQLNSNQDNENLSGVAIRRGQDHPDEYGKMDGQGIKRGVVHYTPIVIRQCKSDTHQINSSSAPVFKIVGSFPTARPHHCERDIDVLCA